MNARLKVLLAKQRKPKMDRSQIGALIESMDALDPTRSHELSPYSRLKSRHNARRALHVFVATGFAGLAILVAACR